MKMKLEVNTVKPPTSFYLKDNEYNILSSVDELRLDSKISSITNYLSSTNGIDKTEEQKDLDYANAQSLWKEYQSDLRDVKFNLNLDRPQYNLLTDILLKKLEYDVNTLFIAIELTELLGSMSGSKYKNDEDINTFSANATEITYMYHLIQNFKIKGLTKEAYTFSKILIRIGELSKIINYYDSTAKSLTEDIAKWALSLDSSNELVKS
jgi:hypothetical protein